MKKIFLTALCFIPSVIFCAPNRNKFAFPWHNQDQMQQKATKINNSPFLYCDILDQNINLSDLRNLSNIDDRIAYLEAQMRKVPGGKRFWSANQADLESVLSSMLPPTPSNAHQLTVQDLINYQIRLNPQEKDVQNIDLFQSFLNQSIKNQIREPFFVENRDLKYLYNRFKDYLNQNKKIHEDEGQYEDQLENTKQNQSELQKKKPSLYDEDELLSKEEFEEWNAVVEKALMNDVKNQSEQDKVSNIPHLQIQKSAYDEILSTKELEAMINGLIDNSTQNLTNQSQIDQMQIQKLSTELYNDLSKLTEEEFDAIEHGLISLYKKV